MDFFGLCDIPIWMILIAVCTLLLYIYGSHPGTIWEKLGVPSPPSRPFFGHMHELFSPHTGSRASIKKWTKEYGKIFGILMFRDPTLIVTDVEILREILIKDFNNYTDRYLIASDYLWQPLVRKGVFFNVGQDWKRIRRIMSPSFSSGKLKLLTSYINTTARQLVDTLNSHAISGSHPEAKLVFSAYSLDALVGPAFGLELNSQENVNGPFYQHAKGLITVRPALKPIMAIAGMFPFLGHLLKLFNITYLPAHDVGFFVKHLTKLVNERKENPDQFENKDFLQFLISAEADSSEDLVGSKKLTTEEIVAQGIIFVIAGYETTSTTLQYLTYELARNQNVQEKIKKEIEDVIGNEKDITYEHCRNLKYTEAVVNETLRMYPPLVNLTRIVDQPRNFKGITVPAKCSILIPNYNIGRDPELFEDPNSFNPDRFMDEQNKPLSNLGFLPFGHGPRQCIGLRLAMIQVKIALVHMLRAVCIEDATPKELITDDYSGFLVPREPIRLILKEL